MKAPASIDIEVVMVPISIRDWFAGMALQGFIVAEPTMQDAKAAEWSYALADAMLAAREGKEVGQ
jgi:hypothetical protein